LERQRLAYYEDDSAGWLTLSQDPITETAFTYDTWDADRYNSSTQCFTYDDAGRLTNQRSCE